ncbi:MAG: thioredoxin family protein, partial [Actinobacteria bacterium]|nr:thioredoxin family protein [Actinomycetota bacterium]
NIKILGSGCKNCVALERNTREALADMDLAAEVTKVTDYPTIASYGIMKTPGLVVDEQVIVSGRVPKPAEIKELLAALA